MNSFYDRFWANKSGALSDFDRKWPHLSRHIPATKGLVILDLGCGKGHVLAELHKLNPDARLIGVDVSPAALEHARGANPKAQCHLIADGGPIPLADASVDFVFSSEVIEHIYDTDNAVREISRVLRPGGRLLLTTPYHGLVKNLLIAAFSFNTHFDPTGAHVRFFTKRTLLALLARHSLEALETDYYGRVFPLSHSIVVVAEKAS